MGESAPRRDLASDQPAEKTAGPIGSIGRKPLRLQVEASLRSHACRDQRRVGANGRAWGFSKGGKRPLEAIISFVVG